MGPQRCRLPARIVLSTLLAALSLSMAAVGAEAASNGLTLAVHVGYQDVVKPGEWTPVTVDAHNTGADVDGTLEVRESLNAQPGVTGFTIYQHPISLAGGAGNRARRFLVGDTTAATVTPRATRTGRVADFVEAGGNLLLGTGASWHKTLAGLPAATLPMEPRATLNVHAARAIGGHNIEVAIADAVSGRAWLSEGAVPLIVDRGVGAGTVTLATFDWNQEPIAGWSGTKDVLRQVLARAVFGAGSSGANYPNGIAFGGPSPALRAQPAVRPERKAPTPRPGHTPRRNLPPLQLTAGLVL